MEIQLIRHGTVILTINGKRLLVDPVLSKKGTMNPIEKVPNINFNPLVELPISIDKIIDCNAVVVTHTHSDHFDKAAAELIPKDKPIICQSQDEVKLKGYGFTEVHPVIDSYIWEGITFNRTEGQHGYGKIAEEMAPVSGFVLSVVGKPVVYIAGDTVWCDKVENSILKYNPDIIVCNCGGAQFEHGKPITMTTDDINELCTKFKTIKVVAVHMEAWNHCRLTRKALRDFVESHGFDNVLIPFDGDILSF